MTAVDTSVVVLGSGPAGYAAAFRCADLGLQTTLVERYPTLGGVCLNVGCIPSKALLHIAGIIEDAREAADNGVHFGEPRIDLTKIRAWKNRVVSQLTSGLSGMAKQRRVQVMEGYGKFTGPHSLRVESGEEITDIQFEYAIIAAGSEPVVLPFLPKDDPRIWDSTDALSLPLIPDRLLVIGGGIIGLEMATVYRSLGSTVHIVEFLPGLIPVADDDVVKFYTRQIRDSFQLMLETRVTAVSAEADGLRVQFDGKADPGESLYDAVLVAVGRRPRGNRIDAHLSGVAVTDAGFIETDGQKRTNVPHIFAVGDVTGQPMLAHKGAHEGHVAAEVISGLTHSFSPGAIPSIAYTLPEIGWVGLTEREARAQQIECETAVFPWAALGRAIASGCSGGMTKLLYEKDSGRIIGGAVVGKNGGEILGEIGLAIEMGADIEDLALTIHAHPSLYESIGLAAEMAEGTITDLPNKKATKKK